MQELSKEDLAKAEAGGFPIVALILLVVFGSLAAAALPLTLGFVSVMVTGALIYFISLQMTTSVFVTNMASMIGIGVAVDYSLFILARYREERRDGRDCDEARSEALATSGLAVAFSGLAVIVSLAGLWMVDNQALRSMALGAMTVVAVSILTATTLLPALIAMLGDRVMPGGIVARVLRFVKYRALPPPPAGGRRPRRRGAGLLGSLGAPGHGPPRSRRHRLRRGPAAAGLAGAVDGDGNRRDRAVPQGQRRPGRQRTRRRAARRRRRSDPDRRHLPRQPRRSRRRRRVRRGAARARPASAASPRPSTPATAS